MHISKKQLAEDWLNEIKSVYNNWYCLRDVGLCGNKVHSLYLFI